MKKWSYTAGGRSLQWSLKTGTTVHKRSCSFDWSRPILEKDIFIENMYIVLSCLIK